MSVAAGTRFGPYEILAPLGAGGMGEVYRARDTRIGREVAVKVLPEGFASDPDRLRRFEQEARAAGSLNHPNILVLHDVGTHEGTPYLVTELLEGESLRERLDHGSISPRKAIDIALQIARGLAAAHERGLVHRDLKPGNLFVLRDGRVKILDFGLAKLTRPEDTRGATATVDTDRSMVMGTAGYMAPEQVRGQPADHRADIFAFGAILYEMLTGRRAFQGETNAETMTAILREEPPDMARDGKPLPPALDRIVRHCLEKSPPERFQSASDIAFALEALSGLSDSGPKRAMSPRRSWRRHVIPAAAALALLAGGVFLGSRFGPAKTGAEIGYQKLTFRNGLIFNARFSPDGHAVYYSASWDGDPPEIYSCNPESPGSLNVSAPPGSYLAAVSRNNELAILFRCRREPHELEIGTLARMEPGGAPREILDDVEEADWSPDASSMAVIHVVGNRYRVEYPIGTVLYESPGWITHMRVSPDGKRVAFLDHPVFPDDRGVVKVVRAAGDAKTISPAFSTAQGLCWSPSGREVWVTAGIVGSNHSIYAVDLGGRARMLSALPNMGRVHDASTSGAVLVTSDDIRLGILGHGPGEERERDLSWMDWSLPISISEDGKKLLFGEEGDGGGEHYAVCLRGMDGSAPVRLADGEAEDISPDGQWVLVNQFWVSPPRLVLYPTGPGQPRVLPPTGLQEIENATFFPTGNRLLVSGNEPGHASRAYVFDPDKGSLRPVAPEGTFTSARVSPDEKWIEAAIRGGAAAIYPLDGGAPRPLAKDPTELVRDWSGDGKALYLSSTVGTSPLAVTRLEIASGKRTLWKSLIGPADRAGITVGIPVVSHDDRSYAYTYTRHLSELFLVSGLK